MTAWMTWYVGLIAQVVLFGFFAFQCGRLFERRRAASPLPAPKELK